MSAAYPALDVVTADAAIDAARRSGIHAANGVLVKALRLIDDPDARHLVHARLAENCAALGIAAPALYAYAPPEQAL